MPNGIIAYAENLFQDTIWKKGNAMKISDNGLNLIKRFEGCRLTAYQDAVGVWTIGYGTTNADKAITGTTICQA